MVQLLSDSRAGDSLVAEVDLNEEEEDFVPAEAS